MIEIPTKLQSAEDLFDPYDPSPAPTRRLNDRAVAHMLALFKQTRDQGGPIVITLLLPESARAVAIDGVLQAAVPAHFGRLADVAASEIRRIKLIGRIFVPIGFVIMAACMVVSELMTSGTERHLPHSIGEGILVLGWVALWAPFEHLLFGRLPVMRERSYYRQLAGAEVRIQYTP